MRNLIFVLALFAGICSASAQVIDTSPLEDIFDQSAATVTTVSVDTAGNFFTFIGLPWACQDSIRIIYEMAEYTRPVSSVTPLESSIELAAEFIFGDSIMLEEHYDMTFRSLLSLDLENIPTAMNVYTRHEANGTEVFFVDITEGDGNTATFQFTDVTLQTAPSGARFITGDWLSTEPFDPTQGRTVAVAIFFPPEEKN